ncbi:MAG: 30S ribosomal protein S11 [Patescibacteria group bacterium]
MGKKRVIQKSGDTTGQQKSTATKARGAVPYAIAHIQATYNNTKISITDDKGGLVAWSSAGALGFSGAKKATPFAAARVVEALVEKTKKMQFERMNIRVSGVGSGRDSAIRALANHGFPIASIKDVTPVPHNGPRPKKVRRV